MVVKKEGSSKGALELRTHTGEMFGILETIPAHVQYADQEAYRTLLVEGGDGPSLMGRN